MEFKGTNKNWRTSKDFREVTTSKIGVLEGSKKICTMSSFCKTDDEVESNAKLIAAAPKMFEMLKSAKAEFGENHFMYKCINELLTKITE